ncbi:anti-sigma factor [Pleurocapsa sp. PCC 7319]|uniref:anti-sigma factor family protein n=1 Tax=Pleurocapsa sp. PCC 7319 TaxID=118161 RepID=UPI0003451481|nr:hypothetical protein [Pleurocapsa sp. PCC 7319]
MTSKFEDLQHNQSTEVPDLETDNLGAAPDYFELVSAYIDGELSASDRNQVQVLLDQDSEVKHLYTQLLALQSQMQNSWAPPSNKSASEVSLQVFREIDRTHNRQRGLVLGGGVLVASLLAAMSGIIPGITPLSFRMANIESPTTVNSDSVMLAVAVNKPAVNIPKAATGYLIETPNTVKN